MTSKWVKEVVDRLRPPAVVKVSKAFRADARHDTAAEQLQHILRHLEKMTCQCRITRLDLSSCSISGQDSVQRGLQGCWHSALAFLSLTLEAMRLAMREQGELQECCRSTQRCLSCA